MVAVPLYPLRASPPTGVPAPLFPAYPIFYHFTMSAHPDTRSYSRPDMFTESGLGEVVVVRPKSGGRLAIGVFLVDVYCLGVKNAFYFEVDGSELDGLLDRVFRSSPEPPDLHSGAWGRKLVERAVDYARKLGFAPHRNYKKAARVFGGIDPKECAEVFTFGHQGKPLFIAGPNESQEKCRLIRRILERKCGVGGSNFIQPASAEDASMLQEWATESEQD